MRKRQLVQIPAEQVKKLVEIEGLRKDIAGYPISKKVHVLLQEKLRDEFGEKVVPPEERVKGRWFEYIRELFPIHIIAPIALGVVHYSREMIGAEFTKILVTSESDKSWWCNYKEDIYNIGDFLLTNLRNKKFANAYYKKYEKLIKDMRIECQKIRALDFIKFSDKELLKQYTFFNEKLMHFYALVFDIDAIDIVLEERMKAKFQKLLLKKGKEKEFNSKYSILTNPPELSYLNVEQLEIYKLAKEVKAKNITPNIKKKINNLVKNYWWTSLGWTVRIENDFKKYVMDIKNIIKKNKNIDEEIRKLTNFAENTKKERQKLAKEFNFDKELEYYLEVFEKYVVYHDYRKEIQMKGTSVMNKFLFELSRRQGMKYEDLVWAWQSEIKNYMKTGTIDLENIRKRKEAYLIVVTKKGIEQLTGEEAIKRRKKELMAAVKNIQDFKGITASLGRITGKAKVCYSATDAIQKVNKGDILIASMTLPDYVTAMKKAAAIVTDEGGVTCHAAIVSRELGIPCIVGTRIATRVLHDGDTVEVNANHGSVRIIRRKS
jgi:phosphohistidine swiveling domain-containing protein